MTERMLGRIEGVLDGAEIRGIRWSAKSLTDRGPFAQETRFGADFLGVLNIELPEFSVSKGFLAQAKLVKQGKIDDLPRLKDQCEKMLNHTPDSFVFLYSNSWVRVIPAISAVAAKFEPLNLYSRSPQRFFEEHLQCFIGDRAISAATPKILQELSRRYEVRSALFLKGGASD